MEFIVFLCLSTFLSNSQTPTKDFGGTSTSENHDPTFLAHPSLVATTIEVVNCNPICVAEAGGPTFTITFSSNTTPLKEEIDYAGMSPVLSGNSSRIKEFPRQLLSPSWPPGRWNKETIQYLNYKVAKVL